MDRLPDMTEPTPREPLRPVPVPTRRIIEVGLIGWMIALVVILAVPALHTGERSWWPWCSFIWPSLRGLSPCC